jgi:uncharacterized membrane protein YqjE
MAEVGYSDSIADLVRGIFGDLRQLMREELQLAKVEIREQAGRAKMAAFALGASLVAIVIGSLFLLIAVAAGVADAFDWPGWAGFLVVGFVLAVVGGVMLATGRRRLSSVHAVPEQTVQTLKENSEWIAKRLSSENK